MCYSVFLNITKRGDFMTTISIRLDEKEKEALQDLAKRRDMTVSQLVRRAIKDYIFVENVTEALNNIPN